MPGLDEHGCPFSDGRDGGIGVGGHGGRHHGGVGPGYRSPESDSAGPERGADMRRRRPRRWQPGPRALKREISLAGELNGGGDGNRTRVQGFAGPCLSHSATPPRSQLRRRPKRRLAGVRIHPKPRYRADDGIRTRDPHLGKVMLYQLSHVRMSVRGDLGPVRRISPALRQNFIRSSPNHQLEPGVAGKNLSPERRVVALIPLFAQLRLAEGGEASSRSG